MPPPPFTEVVFYFRWVPHSYASLFSIHCLLIAAPHTHNDPSPLLETNFKSSLNDDFLQAATSGDCLSCFPDCLRSPRNGLRISWAFLVVIFFTVMKHHLCHSWIIIFSSTCQWDPHGSSYVHLYAHQIPNTLHCPCIWQLLTNVSWMK